MEETRIEKQYQTEIPQSRVERIEFRIHVGRCKRCGKPLRGRHPRQTSDAVGGAASQLGARAVALATQLNKGMGLSHGKTAAVLHPTDESLSVGTPVLETAFGLRVSRGGLAQAFQRVARKSQPTYAKLVEEIRGSPRVTPDETGWKVGGRRWWMWAFSSDKLTVYSIQPGRGYEQARVVLGEDFDGFLVRDGWAVYRGALLKVWGGNRTAKGAHTQSVLVSILQTCRQQLRPATAFLQQLFLLPKPKALDLSPTTPR